MALYCWLRSKSGEEHIPRHLDLTVVELDAFHFNASLMWCVVLRQQGGSANVARLTCTKSHGKER